MLMTDLVDGETTEVKGSGKKPYVLRNIGGVYDCSCVAWKMQSREIDVRTCKHLVKLRGSEAELARVGYDALPTATKKKLDKAGGGSKSLCKSPKKSKKPSAPKEVPPVLLAQTWDDEQDVAGWHVSEKYDGVRAYWDGKNFRSRLGNIFHAPDWFTEGFPDFALDGELWMGRGRFQETSGIARRKNGGDLWKGVTYVVFDIPGLTKTVETRFKAIAMVVAAIPYAVEVPQYLCPGVVELRKALEKIEAQGGEGLMLRQPGSLYEEGRSNTLLKVVSFVSSEGTVIGYINGKGRHKGRIGSLKVRWPNGKEFRVGTGLSDAQRKSPPEIGAVVSFKYKELTKSGAPRHSSFLGERHDVKV
jgi:DNA ligase-1